jgi:glycosyltransferase involved in cell wall biosynthesis
MGGSPDQPSPLPGDVCAQHSECDENCGHGDRKGLSELDIVRVHALIGAFGLEEAVEAPGFVDEAELNRSFAEASCVLCPSLREGHGMVVAEAAAHGVPVVIARTDDNAAIELVDDGVNGVIAPSSSPRDLAGAVLRVLSEGDALRARTAEWFEQNRELLSIDSSIRAVRAAYETDGRAGITLGHAEPSTTETPQPPTGSSRRANRSAPPAAAADARRGSAG